jgi:hypothetical protein
MTVRTHDTGHGQPARLASPLKRSTLSFLLGASLLPGIAAFGQSKPSFQMLQEDFPFQAACIGANFPSNNVALKGYAIRVGNGATVLWDSDTLRMAAGWTGGFINTRGVVFDGAHGQHPQMVGDQKFGIRNGPGVAIPEKGFVDTRPEPFGPIDKAVGHWKGLYVDGMNVVLSYTVRGTPVYEQPGSTAVDGQVGFTRTFRLEPEPSGFLFFKSQKVKEPFTIFLAEVPGATKTIGVEDGRQVITFTQGDTVTKVGAELAVDGYDAVLSVGAGVKASDIQVTIWSGPASAAGSFAKLTQGAPTMVDFRKGGPKRWNQTVNLVGKLNTSATPDGSYVTDSITAPEDNPWKRRVRFGGMDFFSGGQRAALCTHDGDIWIVSGIDEKLENLTWSRFASGLYEPLGLVIVNDQVYVSSREGITRFVDLNQDGEADFYENFNNDVMSTRGFHEFVFDLQRDAAGNFYFAKANPVNGGGRGFGDEKASRGNGVVCSHAGCLFKVSPDGKTFEVVARGFRAPNGIGVRADGQLTTGDNEGTWVPTSPINWVDGKAFHGVINTKTPKEAVDQYVPPIMWLSHSDFCNSNGGQIWVTSDKWGPFKDELLYESYGKSSLFLVMRQDLGNGRQQAAAVRFPLKFTSSVMRARFHPYDGQLYVCGLSEWQSNAARITGFDRVRYTGKPVYSVNGIKVVPGGVQLSFTQPLDKASAEDVQNWSGKRWNYIRSENYGSPEVWLSNPEKKGRESLNIIAAKLGADGKTVTLTIEDLRPVNQQSLKWDIKAADGTTIAQEIQETIHEIPGVPLSKN